MFTRVMQLSDAVLYGAVSELNVIDFTLVELYDEVTKMKTACGVAHLKTILATGELGSLANVYKASLVCMMAG